MAVTIGTFNLNNLFSRYNFSGVVSDSFPVANGGITLSFGDDQFEVRTFMGRLVKEKKQADTTTIARRITEQMQADIIAVQEVEHIEILKEFNRNFLNNAYSEIVLIEGNDTRLIDVGFLSKLPIGAITSHQAKRHPDRPGLRVFGRDLLEVEFLDDNGDLLFTAFNTHMKSHFVPRNQDPVEGARRADLRRRQQAEMTREILSDPIAAGRNVVLLGDMNDPPESPHLEPMLDPSGQRMINALENATETRPPKRETAGQGQGPTTSNWTHRFNPPGPTPPKYEMFDQIWVSPGLGNRIINSKIDRRTKHSGDGSDHDPAWVELDL